MDSVFTTIFEQFKEVRYIAIYQNAQLSKRQRESELSNSSSGETDTYEELLVNPVLLKLATQRGDIDCGGLRFLIICYGHFTQIVKSVDQGHASVCLEKSANASEMAPKIFDLIDELLS